MKEVEQSPLNSRFNRLFFSQLPFNWLELLGMATNKQVRMESDDEGRVVFIKNGQQFFSYLPPGIGEIAVPVSSDLTVVPLEIRQRIWGIAQSESSGEVAWVEYNASYEKGQFEQRVKATVIPSGKSGWLSGVQFVSTVFEGLGSDETWAQINLEASFANLLAERINLEEVPACLLLTLSGLTAKLPSGNIQEISSSFLDHFGLKGEITIHDKAAELYLQTPECEFRLSLGSLKSNYLSLLLSIKNEPITDSGFVIKPTLRGRWN